MEKPDSYPHFTLPTYEESVNQTPEYQLENSQSITDRVTTTRAALIHSVINDHILPAIDRNSRSGIGQTEVFLLPAESGNSAGEESKSEYGFDDYTFNGAIYNYIGNDGVSISSNSSKTPQRSERLETDRSGIDAYQLSEPLTFPFWKQKGLLKEFERLLQERLTKPQPQHIRTEGTPPGLFKKNEENKDSTYGRTDGRTDGPGPRHRKRSFMSRLSFGSSSRECFGTPSRPEDENNLSDATLAQLMMRFRSCPTDGVKVDVAWDDVGLRTTNLYGIYDRISSQAIVVKVDANI